MSGNENLAASVGFYDEHACLAALRHNFQSGHFLDILAADLGMAAVRRKEAVVESAEQRVFGIVDVMLEHAEHLVVERIFRHSEVIVQSGLRRPTDVEC